MWLTALVTSFPLPITNPSNKFKRRDTPSCCREACPGAAALFNLNASSQVHLKISWQNMSDQVMKGPEDVKLFVTEVLRRY